MSNDNFGVSEGQDGPHIITINHAEPAPKIAPPQHSFRNPTKSHEERSSEGPPNNRTVARAGAHSDKTCAQSSNSWSKTTSYSDQNSRLVSPDSVVINLDNINEPSTSYSVGSHRHHSGKLFPEQQPLDMLARDKEDQNSLGELVDGSTSPRLNNSGFINESVVSATQSNEGLYDDSFINNNTNALVAENSEGTQTDNSNLRPPTRNSSLFKIFNKYTPFLTFLLLKITYDHREGILIFAGLLVTFIHANSVIKREIAKQNRRSLLSLGIIFVNLFLSICLIYFVFQDQQLYKNLVFIPLPTQPLTLWDVLWIVGITDFVLKFITIQLKVGLVCFPERLLPYLGRGKWYLLLERISQLYRCLVPIQPWLYYLMEIYQGPENTVGLFFCVAYFVSKGSDITSKVKLLVKAFWKLLHNTSLGSRPSKEQMVTVGSQCPICHDEYSAPIMLKCSHVFCESCVLVWFDREQTCPLCRAKIADDPSWRDGATSFFIHLF